MGFLDNSGDIVLDAVLTDTGRMRLAKGDGSFKISKFALADDEINYGIYDKNHASGSAYYDLEILQTPVLEAFTNNTSCVKHRLLSISRTNLLYLPELALNKNGRAVDASGLDSGGVALHLVTVDNATEIDEDLLATKAGNGILLGRSTGTSLIEVHQGLNTSEISYTHAIDSDLNETQYIVEMDNRLGFLKSTDGSSNPTVSYIDDDNIASYYVSLSSNSNMVASIGTAATLSDSATAASAAHLSGQKTPISGPRGTYLKFSIGASLELQTSTYLFDLIGLASNPEPMGVPCRAIDTTIRVTGVTTGTSIDIPIRYIKKV